MAPVTVSLLRSSIVFFIVLFLLNLTQIIVSALHFKNPATVGAFLSPYVHPRMFESDVPTAHDAHSRLASPRSSSRACSRAYARRTAL
ncbi:hypothetical protein OH76DRAFT_1401297 [Lentinus brumalis]|uniref:Uncharacterized protein n=1 Tax=Lentinus brumalis TaxID=2498619 RepID=A0A371DFY2_9APHY|nr:hypothetical protein OH76DRAFT_1401297 [Polyporus brumalis]